MVSIETSALKDFALCILPPSHIAQALDEIRNRFDKASARWPCHIRLSYIYPRCTDPSVRSSIEASLFQSPQFQIRLRPPQIGSSSEEVTKGKDGRVYITCEVVAIWCDLTISNTPENYISNLLTKLNLAQPRNRFNWHLSLAQMPNRQRGVEFQQALATGWDELNWIVDSLDILEQTTKKYRQLFQFRLTNTENEQVEENDFILPVWKNLLRKGNHHIQILDYDNAVKFATDASLIAPDRPLPLCLLGEAYIGCGRLAEALESFNKARAQQDGATDMLQQRIQTGIEQASSTPAT